MNAADYPNFQAWVTLLQQRDAGFLLVTLLAVTMVGILINCRWLAPKYLPTVRSVMIAAFYASLLFAVLKGG